MHSLYVGGLANVLAALPQPAPRFVYVSSTSVYGQTDGEEVDERATTETDRLGMHVTDQRCLGILFRAGPITAGDLAERTGLTPEALTGVIDRLEKAGREIAPLFESVAHLMADLCARYGTRDLGVIRDFIARVHQGVYGEIRMLQEGAGNAEPAKGSRRTPSA